MPARRTALVLISLLVPRFARRTANGERQRPQPLLRDLDLTLQALSVLSRLDPAEGLVEASERVRLALEEREVDGILGAHLRVVADVTDLAASAGAPIALSTLHVLEYLAPAGFQQPPQFCPSLGGHVVSVSCGSMPDR
jgi:hypothetical protein